MSNDGSVKSIPAVRRMVINDPSQLPLNYGTTPGGSLFSTTPGGTRIYYDRSFLLQCRNSPLAKSPPSNMAKIPGVSAPIAEEPESDAAPVIASATPVSSRTNPVEHKDDPQFEMDI